MNQRYVKAVLVLLILFLVFLPLYYLFSYGNPDGLQKAVSQGDGGTDQPIWQGLFGYGTNPVETFLVGVLGLVIVFLLAYGLLRVTRAWRFKDDGNPHSDSPRP